MEVVLLEKEAEPGGKWRSLCVGDFQFEFGETSLVLPWLVEQVFWEAGEPASGVRLNTLDVACRHFFMDGTVIDAAADPDWMAFQLRHLALEDREGFLAWVLDGQRWWEQLETVFHGDSGGERWTKRFARWWHACFLPALDEWHRNYFTDPRLIAILNRHALATGLSPFHAPAWLTLAAYLEWVQGAGEVEGGASHLVEELVRLAERKGAKLLCGISVDEIVIQDGRATGVRAGGELWKADVLLCDVNTAAVRMRLFPDMKGKRSRVPKGISAMFCFWGVDKCFSRLHRHNSFYPDLSGREYIDLFEQEVWPFRPAIYLGNSSFAGAGKAPEGGSALCAMIRVPAAFSDEWKKENQRAVEEIRRQILFQLEADWGLEGLEAAITEERVIGPEELEARGGAVGGTWLSPPFGNRWNPFRPFVKEEKVDGLMHIGSSCFPGGISAALRSGLAAAKAVLAGGTLHG
jgi:phytoene dehydrogenase-like protein